MAACAGCSEAVYAYCVDCRCGECKRMLLCCSDKQQRGRGHFRLGSVIANVE